MKPKTALEGILNFAAFAVALGIPSIPLIWLLRLPDEQFSQLFHGIGLPVFRAMEVAALVVWLGIAILLSRLFERLLDRLLDRPRSPWLKK
ncbi:hypothetical protein [Brevundimonas sp. NIBR11]|uniref:hypothetical protein n=1 Tax=Brevundimonas sp. NIBR11 TaxID=3015999 RepID=UPI0022F03127|nr:hypothetical protein [Brevundimonas sp. NIBR11]